MKNLLITGSGGFLGNNVLNKLNSIQHNFNLFTPKSSELNLLNFDALFDYCKLNKIDQILHMAAVCAGIKGNANNPGYFLYANTQMALHIYQVALCLKISYIHSIGSVCMYPKFCSLPFKENDIWNGAAEETNFPYGQAKRTLMMLGQTYREQYGIKGSFLLPVNMFGPHDTFNTTTSHVIPSLIVKFINAKKNNLSIVECWSTKENEISREFLYVDDCAEIISQVILSEFDYDLPINVGTGKEIKIVDLAYLIAKLVGYTGDILFNGQFDGQPRRCLDISRAHRLLNWKAKTSLQDGLIKTIKWYQENYES